MLSVVKIFTTTICIAAAVSINSTLWARGGGSDSSQGRSQGISQQDQRDRGAAQSQSRPASSANAGSSRSSGENRSYNSDSRGNSASSSRSAVKQSTPASQTSSNSRKSVATSSSNSSSSRAVTAPSAPNRSSSNSSRGSAVLDNWERGAGSRVTTVTGSRSVNRNVDVSGRSSVTAPVSRVTASKSAVVAPKSSPTKAVYSNCTGSDSRGSSQVDTGKRTRVMEPVASNTRARTESKPAATVSKGKTETQPVVKGKTETKPSVVASKGTGSKSAPAITKGKTDSKAPVAVSSVKSPTKTSVAKSSDRGSRTEIVKGTTDKRDSDARSSRQVNTDSRTNKVASQSRDLRDSGRDSSRDSRSPRDISTSSRTRQPMAGVTKPMRSYSDRGGPSTSVIRSHVVVNNNYGRRPGGDYRDGHGDSRDGHGDYRDRHDGDRDRHDYSRSHYDNRGHYWRPAYYSHHDSWSFSFGFYRPHYHFCHWAPIVYEPVYTPIWDPVMVYEPVVYQPAYVNSTYIAADTVVYPTRRVMYYGYGPGYTVSYVYPQYHRRYMFVSVGGYWPGYTYSRYYWYGVHPYTWYGAAPTAYAIGDTQVYTYQRYQDSGALTTGSTVAGVQVPDYDGLIQAGQKIKMEAASEPPTRPEEPTATDTLFDEGVTAFGKGDYNTAEEKLRTAVRMEPNDAVLPFAYAQVLFANKEYEKAAAVVYTALTELYPQQPEVFYPRGMYTDENLLNTQIANLERAVMMDPANVQMQLLLGYHYLGVSQFDKALTPLTVAQRDGRTQAPATALLALMEKAKAGAK